MTLEEIVQVVGIFVLSLFSSLFTSILIQRKLRARKVPNILVAANAANAARALNALGKAAVFSLEDFPDNDGDGVPDAFQNRKPLSEMLGFEKADAEPGEITGPGRIDTNTNQFWIAIELPARAPRKHEYFLFKGEIFQSTMNYSDMFKAVIIKQTRGCRPEDLAELSK